MSHPRSKRFALAFSLLAVSFLQTQAPAPSAPPADLDSYVSASMKTFDVPGVAIVKDGKIVVAKGYGARKLGDPAVSEKK